MVSPQSGQYRFPDGLVTVAAVCGEPATARNPDGFDLGGGLA
jgi:hypothetical protein